MKVMHMENQALRRYYGMKEDQSGVLITKTSEFIAHSSSFSWSKRLIFIKSILFFHHPKRSAESTCKEQYYGGTSAK